MDFHEVICFKKNRFMGLPQVIWLLLMSPAEKRKVSTKDVLLFAKADFSTYRQSTAWFKGYRGSIAIYFKEQMAIHINTKMEMALSPLPKVRGFRAEKIDEEVYMQAPFTLR